MKIKTLKKVLVLAVLGLATAEYAYGTCFRNIDQSCLSQCQANENICSRRANPTFISGSAQIYTSQGSTGLTGYLSHGPKPFQNCTCVYQYIDGAGETVTEQWTCQVTLDVVETEFGTCQF